MKIIVGLGNPGKKFLNTRHNLGFLVLDKIQNDWAFPEFKNSEKFLAKISLGKINNEKIILVKPQTFMNNSGKAVKLLFDYYKLKTENLFVVHDDLDIIFSKIKISFGKNAGGHKGVQSIIDYLGSRNFLRFRVGIKPKTKQINPENFVLEEFAREEKKFLKSVLEKTKQAIEKSILMGPEKAMTEFNK